MSPSQINQPVEQDTLSVDKMVVSCPELPDTEFKKICAAANKLKLRKPSRWCVRLRPCLRQLQQLHYVRRPARRAEIIRFRMDSTVQADWTDCGHRAFLVFAPRS